MNVMIGDTDTRKIGMASSYPNSTDEFTYEDEVYDGYEPVDNRLIMKELNRQRLLMLFSSKGAVLGKDVDGFLFLKYWKRLSVLNRRSQVIMRKPIVHLSGFCSRNRGIHWRI